MVVKISIPRGTNGVTRFSNCVTLTSIVVKIWCLLAPFSFETHHFLPMSPICPPGRQTHHTSPLGFYRHQSHCSNTIKYQLSSWSLLKVYPWLVSCESKWICAVKNIGVYGFCNFLVSQEHQATPFRFSLCNNGSPGGPVFLGCLAYDSCRLVVCLWIQNGLVKI